MTVDHDALEGIRRTVALYGHVVDNHQWGRLREVYTDNAVLDLSNLNAGVKVGLPAIRHFLEGHPSPSLTLLTTNTVIDHDPGSDKATGLNKWLSVRQDGSIGAGYYTDEYRRTAGGWRIQRRTTTRLTPSPLHSRGGAGI